MPSPRKKQDLLEFYRRRETEAEEDMKALRGRLDSIEATQRQMHELEWSVVQKDRELSETRKREGALQEILFGERDNALRLQARIDRLQLLREEDRRKIAFLLTLTTDSSSARQRHGETTYFVPTHKVPHAKTMKAAAAAASSSSSSLNESYSELPPEETIELLRHAVGALKRQLEEQRRITREHTQVLVEGKATLEEALEQRVEEQNAQMEKMVKEIERLRTALTDTTRDFLEERAAFRARERLRMEQSEEASGRVERAGEQVAETRRALHEQQEEAIAEAMRRCEGTVDGFRRRTVALEREVKRAQAETDAAQELKRRAGRLLKERMAQMQRRVEEERRRRRVEREGFDCDRTRLTQRISTLEQQLTESLERTTSHPNPTSAHSEPLSVLTQTAQRSRKVQSDLNRLKSHIYKVEGDLRKL